MFDFPASPTEGQQFVGASGMPYVYKAPAWRQRRGTAQALNRIVNPAMQISQQNQNLSGAANGYYAADGWYMTFVSATGVFTAQRVEWTTLDKSNYRFRVYVQTAASALGATDFLLIGQLMEGLKVADFRWGTVAAKQAILRFNFYGPAGTYGVSVRNGAGDRSWVSSFTLASLSNGTFTFVIPGDTAGVWPIDETRGMQVWITLASGSTYIGVPGWQAGPFLGLPGQINGKGTATNMFELSDVGLYLDPDKTGVAPPWETPDPAEELRQCQRYWYRAYSMKGMLPTAAVIGRIGMTHPVQMRIVPAGAVVGALRMYDGIATAATTISASASNVDVAEFNMNASGMTIGRSACTLLDSDDIYMAMNARV